jgi:filamentous hemagglutinin
MVRCAAGVPVTDPNYNYLKGLQDAGATMPAEQALLIVNKQTTAGTLFDYGLLDQTSDWLSQNKVGVRVAGAGQAGLGVLGAVGSAGLCTTGLGCLAGMVGGSVSLDYGIAGAKQVWTGDATQPYGEQVLQSLGLSPAAASYTYAAIGLTPAAIDAAMANKAVNAAVEQNKLAVASYQDFATGGIKATPEIMQSPQAQALIQEFQAANPGLSTQSVEVMAKSYIESGANLPQAGIAAQGAPLVKVVPKGERPTDYTGYWMSPQQAQAIATMTPEQIGQTLGLPAGQAAKIISNGVDYYAISANPGLTPKVFVSDVATTSQGTVTMPGGAQQVIVPNRSQWTDPVKVNPFTLH